MNIHEYQGKAILKSFGVRVQEGIVADTAEQAVEAAKKLKVDYNSVVDAVHSLSSVSDEV